MKFDPTKFNAIAEAAFQDSWCAICGKNAVDAGWDIDMVKTFQNITRLFFSHGMAFLVDYMHKEKGNPFIALNGEVLSKENLIDLFTQYFEVTKN
jgi:hypothetical protein